MIDGFNQAINLIKVDYNLKKVTIYNRDFTKV